MAEVIVSQPEFGFRPTGGSYDVVKDCKSDLSLIQGVRGRTVSWNQLLPTADLTKTVLGVTFVCDNGLYTITGTSTGTTGRRQYFNTEPIQVVSGHKYYKNIPADTNLACIITNKDNTDSVLNVGRGKGIITASTTISNGGVGFNFTSSANFNITAYMQLIDLTAIYGSGNEPTTPEAFEADYEAWFGKPLTYEAYCAGELRNLTATGIKTVGFNQLPNDSESVVWNQLIYNSDSSGFVAVNSTFTFDGHTFSVSKGRKTTSGGIIRSNYLSVNSSHKYYLSISLRSLTSGQNAYYGFLTSPNYSTGGNTLIGTSSSVLTKDSIITSPVNNTDMIAMRIGISTSPSGTAAEFVDPILIDLTLLFGEGKEPTTVEEFESWLLKYKQGVTGFFPYDSGSQVTFTELDSPLIANMQYQLTGIVDDDSDEGITLDGEPLEVDSNGKFTPTKSGTILAVGGVFDDACLHFVHSGRRDNEYEEHWESTKNLPITTMTGKLLVNGQPSGESVVLAPHGMLQAGSVKDEIRIVDGKRYYYKYVGDVRLDGSQTPHTARWRVQATSTGTAWPYSIAPTKRISSSKTLNITSDKFAPTNYTNLYANNDLSNVISGYNDGTAYGLFTRIPIVATTDAEVITYFTNNPVTVNFELATPEVYLLDEEYQEDSMWSYKCDDWGTEFLVSPETPISHTIYQSAPLHADILYGSGPMKRYTVEFKDRADRTVIIDIADESTLGQYTTLTGAENPLEIAEDDDHDPLLPVRASVARIRVVCNYADLIQIRTDLQWSVRIQREGALIWQGFLRTDMPDADLAAIPGEVFYIADDLLGCLKSIQKTLPRSRKTFKNLLERAYSFLDNSIPVLSETGKPWETLQALSVEPWNWIEEEENEEGVDESVPDKANVVEEDILQFLGVCARYWNNRFYMGSLFGTKFYEDEAETTVEPIDGSSLEWTGFHSMKSEQGKGLVTVESAGREVEDESVPSFKGNDYTVESYGYLPPQTDYVTAGNNAYYRSLLPIDNSGVWLKQFTQAGEAGNILGRLGVHILDLDFWQTQQTEPKKANFTFSRSLLFVGVGLGKDGTEYPMTPTFTYSATYSPDAVAGAFNLLCEGVTEPVAIFKSPSVLAKDGGFTLKIELSGIDYSVSTSGGNKYRTINSVASPAESYQTVLFTLRFGDKYWGGMWADTPVYGMYFSTNVNPFLYVGKTIDFDFGGEGMALPVDGVMSGDVELCIYGCFDVRTTEDTSGGHLTYTTTISPEPVYNLSTIDLQYHAPLSVLDIQNRESYRCSQRTLGFPVDNAKDVGLTLCSDDSINDNWGWVYSGNNILKTLHWPKLRQTMKPEQLVLKKNVLSLSRIRNYANLSVRCEYDDLPFRRVNFLDRTWYPLAVSTNMRLCTSEVLMMDITDIMASLPAVGTDEESRGGDTPVVATAAYQMVTLTLQQALDVPVAVLWSTNTRNGTATIETGQDSVTFDAGETIADERDISINLSATGYTFNIVWSFT